MYLKVFKILCVLVAALLIIPTSVISDPYEHWEEGDEVEITGHSFDEDYWTNTSITNTTDEGDVVDFTVSYINDFGVEVFYVALKSITTDEGIRTIPYQIYGLHYYTPEGQEIFITATFAFLYVYNDTNGNNIPDNEEDKFIVQPFGAGNDTWVPEITVMPVEKLGEGHYRFGIKYENMYGGIFIGALPWFVAKFSEFTINYDVTIDNDTGEITTETYYTLGQVLETYQWFVIYWPKDPSEVIKDDMAIAAVHHVTVFASKYRVTSSDSGNTINKEQTSEVEEIVVEVGDEHERAFKIRSHGTFDLLDESTNPYTTVENDKTAYNIIVRSTFFDVIKAILFNPLFGASAAISARITAIFGYALSDYIQDHYTSPKDLAEKALNPFNPNGFGAIAFWYAVAFPNWQGYRVEHDPTYIAYFGEAQEPEEDETTGLCASTILVVGFAAVPGIVIFDRKRRHKKRL